MQHDSIQNLEEDPALPPTVLEGPDWRRCYKCKMSIARKKEKKGRKNWREKYIKQKLTFSLKSFLFENTIDHMLQSTCD